VGWSCAGAHGLSSTPVTRQSPKIDARNFTEHRCSSARYPSGAERQAAATGYHSILNVTHEE
jgi:hypothetical protein